MSDSKKFGTFGGVFTPSILTILGVIMYLRLPWIVGQAGLWMTIGIIVIAHVISVTTGLSVASIATDKKVKVGGNYYIISRSLGLPIGGTLGIALFVGLSFSVSLYIIGFIESFLPFWGITPTPDAIRLYGTIAVILVSLIILVSTSLAIKTQFLIMAAIVGSLVSIVFSNPELRPDAAAFQPMQNAESLVVLFGIFFPAVTGFTAGVQMSGDLKDPRKSIPRGTIGSILVGFVVYISMAVYLSYQISRGALVSNTNILVEAGAVPALIYAGIWGATLSSAMGSLLGAPRILQATSLDRITPRIFARGYGEGNEPRNALILTFLIAEVGILIGELNVIAAIISIFFITTYGFINLSCAVENWASTDFRPSFRIPNWVSVVGAVACFLVMVQLDLLSFIGATLLLFLLYVYLKRKELTLESGDTWEGVWSSIVRSALHRLSSTRQHTRNWRPNIILFSGGTNARPHLIEFGRWLVRKRGILSNFDLIESKSEKSLFTKSAQALSAESQSYEGIFSRRLNCRDIYEGMESIGQVYGFSGVDPNTVLMGWARNSKDPAKFAHLVRQYTELDFNILMLDYDRERGFGERKRIDIWWRGGNNNATLALTILKFLKASDEWERAEARILILVDDSALGNRAFKNMNQILEEQRIQANVVVINNAIDRRPFRETVGIESVDADLIMLGLPLVSEKNAPQFVDQVNHIVNNLGSTLLVHASSTFEPLYIGIESSPVSEPSEPEDTRANKLPDLVYPRASADGDTSYDKLAKIFNRLLAQLENGLADFSSRSITQVFAHDLEIIARSQSLFERCVTAVEKLPKNTPGPRGRRAFSRIRTDFLYGARQALERYKTEVLELRQQEMASGIQDLLELVDSLLKNSKPAFNINYHLSDMQPAEGDSFYLKRLKWWKRIAHRLSGNSISIKVRYQDLLEHSLKQEFLNSVLERIKNIGIQSYQTLSQLQAWYSGVEDALTALEKQLMDHQVPTKSIIKTEATRHLASLDAISNTLDSSRLSIRTELQLETRQIIQNMIDEIVRLDVNQRIHTQFDAHSSQLSALRSDLLASPGQISFHYTRILNFTQMTLHLMLFRHRLSAISYKVFNNLQQFVDQNLNSSFVELETALTEYEATASSNKNAVFKFNTRFVNSFSDQKEMKSLLNDIYSAVNDLPEIVEIIGDESFQQIDQKLLDEPETVTIHLRRLVDYLVETTLTSPLQEHLRQIPSRLQRSVNTGEDIVRLAHYNLTANGVDTEDGPVENVSTSEIVANAVGRIEAERIVFDELISELDRLIQSLLDETSEKLRPYLLIKSSGLLGQYIRSKESRRVISGVEKWTDGVKQSLRSLSTNLLYRKSTGLILAKRLVDEQNRRDIVPTLLNMVENSMPPDTTMAALPFYYRQLFLGKQPIGREFWVGQKRALGAAEKAIQRFRAGRPGAILLLGDTISGKTAMSRRIARQFFDSSKIFFVSPVEGGSTDPDRFQLKLAEATGLKGSFDQIFRFIPQDSVVIINDLELWWERSRSGFAVLNQLRALIEQYGRRCLFLINCQTSAYRLINTISHLNDLFIGQVFVDPMNAQDLQQSILLRHRSSGLNFELNDQPESSLSSYKLAKLFTRFYECSDGNVGAAFHLWISHIRKGGKDTFAIELPEKPDIRPLESLDPDWQVVVQQLMYHKQLSEERFSRVFRIENNRMHRALLGLLRSGLIVENAPGVFSVNSFLQRSLDEHF